VCGEELAEGEAIVALGAGKGDMISSGESPSPWLVPIKDSGVKRFSAVNPNDDDYMKCVSVRSQIPLQNSPWKYSPPHPLVPVWSPLRFCPPHRFLSPSLGGGCQASL